MAEIVPAFAIKSSLLGSFGIFPSTWVFCFCFSSISLFPGTMECSRLILYIPCPSPRSSHFSKKLWFLVLVSGVRNQIWVLGVLVGIGVSLLLGPCSWESKEMSVCTLTCVYTYICKYFCMWASVSINKLNVSSSWNLQRYYHVGYSGAFFLLLCTRPLQQWQIWPPDLPSICLIVQFKCTCIVVSELLTCIPMGSHFIRVQCSTQFYLPLIL